MKIYDRFDFNLTNFLHTPHTELISDSDPIEAQNNDSGVVVDAEVVEAEADPQEVTSYFECSENLYPTIIRRSKFRSSLQLQPIKFYTYF